MAVATTGAIYKSLSFDGVESRNFGVYITGEAVYNAPARDVEMVSIPGRSGAFALDKGRFENIEVTYPAGIFADNETDFAEAISDFRNFLCSRRGYVRLTDEYNPNEYRMAIYKSGLEVSPAQLKAGEFNLVFDCKPQRWLTSGEDAVTIGEWGDTETVEGSIATFEGEEWTGIKSLVADIEPIQDLNGYDYPWVGGTGKNKLPYPYYDDSQTKNGITFTVNSDGTVVANGTATAEATFYFLNNQSLASIGLTSGTYTLNGCPSGGSSSTYRIQIRQNGAWREETGSGLTFTYDASSPVNDLIRIDILSGATVNDIVFKPMIRLSSVSDATYEPYANICPISGYDSVVVSRTGKNLLPYPYINTSKTDNGVTWTVNADGTITANGTATSESQFVLTGSVVGDDYVGKRFSALTRAAGAPWEIRASVQLYGSPWTTLGADYGNGVTVPNTASGKNIRFLLFVASGATVTNEVFKPMIRLASETDATYKPYQGTTYTTSLNGTRYGGTLDVTTGVLTVTHKRVVITDVNQLGTGNTSTYGYYVGIKNSNDAKYINEEATAISSMLKSVSESDKDNATNRTLFRVYVASNNYVVIQAPSTSTISTNAELLSAINNVEIVYELATPQTVQLTAQQVSALVGTNNIWADTGDVTVEYGADPNKLVNPTLFDSSPLIVADGYGAINFNEYTINIEDIVVGDVLIAGAQTINNNNVNVEYDDKAATFSSGDQITIKNIVLRSSMTITTAAVFIQEQGEDDRPMGIIYWNSPDTDATLGYSCSGKVVSFSMTIPQITLTIGVNQTLTYKTRATVKVQAPGQAWERNSEYATTTIKYSNGKIKITAQRLFLDGGYLPTAGPITQNSITIEAINGYSTTRIEVGTKYIDCDLGEAYLLDGDTSVNLNQHIDLGSDLPKLASGVNEVTYDNTITGLKFLPRWWKV